MNHNFQIASEFWFLDLDQDSNLFLKCEIRYWWSLVLNSDDYEYYELLFIFFVSIKIEQVVEFDGFYTLVLTTKFEDALLDLPFVILAFLYLNLMSYGNVRK